jgi:hypothetical protein
MRIAKPALGPMLIVEAALAIGLPRSGAFEARGWDAATGTDRTVAAAAPADWGRYRHGCPIPEANSIGDRHLSRSAALGRPSSHAVRPASRRESQRPVPWEEVQHRVFARQWVERLSLKSADLGEFGAQE